MIHLPLTDEECAALCVRLENFVQQHPWLHEFWRWMEAGAGIQYWEDFAEPGSPRYWRKMGKYLKHADRGADCSVLSAADLTEQVPAAMRARFDEEMAIYLAQVIEGR